MTKRKGAAKAAPFLLASALPFQAGFWHGPDIPYSMARI